MDYSIYAIDIILAATVVIFVAVGCFRGLTGLVISSIDALLACIGAKLFSTTLAESLYFKILEPRLVEKIAEKAQTVTETGEELVGAVIPQGLRGVVAHSGISADIAASAEPQKLAVEIAGALIEPALVPLLRSALFVLFTVILFLLLRAITSPLNSLVLKIPVIGTANRLAGVVFGAVMGVAAVSVAAAVLGLAAVPLSGTRAAEYIDSSRIVHYVCYVAEKDINIKIIPEV